MGNVGGFVRYLSSVLHGGKADVCSPELEWCEHLNSFGALFMDYTSMQRKKGYNFCMLW